ncbi:MAG: toll/interleukin-1 receptor domain-containing protein [Solirubrobacterales bacterium]
MGGGKAKKIFISHGVSAMQWAEELAAALQAADPDFVATRALDIPPGSDSAKWLRQAVQDSDVIVLLVVADSGGDDRYQWTEVLQEHWRDQAKPLVPVLLDGASPPPFLKGLSFLDAELDQPPGGVADWILARMEESSPASRVEHEIDTRTQLLKRLDASIAALSAEQPDEEELREHREALERSCGEELGVKELALAHLNIGLIDLELRDHPEALKHLHEALEICEAAAIEGYPNRVSILIPLSDTLAEMEEFNDALKRLREAAAIRAEEDGGESPGVIAIKQELGALLVRARNYSEAVEVLSHTLEVNQRELGPTHPRVEANKLWLSLAQEHLDSGESSAGAEFLGVEPVTRVTSLVGLGYLMIQSDDLCGAQAALGRAVQLADGDPQIPAPIQASCWFYNGVALCRTRQWKEAVEELRKAAEANKELHIDEGWAKSMFHLGTALRSRGDTDEAVRVLSEVLSAAGDIYGGRSSEVADGLYNLGLALRDKGEYEGARAKIEEAASMISALAGSYDPRVIKYRRILSRLDQVAA